MVEKILLGIQSEMRKCSHIDELNKIYRHARIWVRYNYVVSGVDKEYAKEVNEILKNMRWQRMKEMGYLVPDKFEGFVWLT